MLYIPIFCKSMETKLSINMHMIDTKVDCKPINCTTKINFLLLVVLCLYVCKFITKVILPSIYFNAVLQYLRIQECCKTSN